MKQYATLKTFLYEIIQNTNVDIIKHIIIKLIDKIRERYRYIYLTCQENKIDDKINVCIYMLVKFTFENIIRWSHNKYICIFEYKEVLNRLS